MFKKIWKRLFPKPTKRVEKTVITETIETESRSLFSTDDVPRLSQREALDGIWERVFKQGAKPYASQHKGVERKDGYATAMDATNIGIKTAFDMNTTIPENQVLWYASQSFIGYQLCAMISQQWLVGKACMMPAKDATRNGYTITVNDGTEVAPEVLDAMRRLDAKFRVNKNMIEFVHMGRVFGIRIAMFIVESEDPEYYSKPFNPDGVKPNSYKGISQIDPYWCAPELDNAAAGDPSSIHFYEPTWWQISGKRVHRSHLIIFRTEQVPDVMKPSYIYGGIPIPQKVYERVYAAERTANEAPMLALTKRTNIFKTDVAKALANQQTFDLRMQQMSYNWNNYGTKVIGEDDEMTQLDITLNDLDEVIMTQYQIVAAAANVPATKLLGTTPKGFNSTGEYEEANYHEELESIQTHDLTPLLERHHMLLIRSYIAPEFNISPFETTVAWESLDAMTAKEQAEVNRTKAETDNILSQIGAVDGTDVRKRIVNDPESNYSGLIAEDDLETPYDEETDPEVELVDPKEGS